MTVMLADFFRLGEEGFTPGEIFSVPGGRIFH